MKNSNIKIYLFVVFSYLFFALVLTLLYIGFLNTYIKDNQIELVDEKSSYVISQLSQTLEGDFNYLKTNDSLVFFDNLVINKIDVSPLKEIEINKIPDMKNIDDSFTGLNYYIYNTTVNSIIRKLAIVIHESTRDTNWGLYDDYASFD
ncbi:hypothetical protein [Haploplasma modicum]|uniref:hypothetical protein n=1 Tax=Haploplasma modicum TaxID=2150 RepID=UPI0004797384|nr:hypothetical protein [Haploplasma modicum]